MVIWSGLGWVPVVLLIAIGVGLTAITGPEVFDESAWPVVLAFIITALLTFGLGWWLRQRAASLVDPQTGRKVRQKHGHTLFFIPMEYASVGLLILGIGIALFYEPQPSAQAPQQSNQPIVDGGVTPEEAPN